MSLPIHIWALSFYTLFTLNTFEYQTTLSMKSVSNLFGWLKNSNRPKHLKAGCVIFLLWIIGTILLTGITMLQAAFTGLVCVLVAMCSVEYIQESSGGVWDWLDILAGIIVPGILTLLFWLWILFSL